MKLIPHIQSVTTPDGIVHVNPNANGRIPADWKKKWHTRVDKYLKKKFQRWEKRIKEFAKRLKKFKDYKGKFDPTQFKVEEGPDGKIIYTIQFEIDDNKHV